MTFRDFNSDLQTGKRAEELFITTFKGVFEPVLKKIEYDLFPESQRQGVDVLLSKKSVEFDVKVRDNWCYGLKDILVETVSVRETNKPGWIYTNTSSYIVYLWWNTLKTRFVDGYLIYLPHFKPFFKQNINLFKQPPDAKTRRGNQVWHTQNRIVPIYKIPINCIKQVDMSLLGVKDQLLLSNFFEIKDVKKQALLSEEW